MRRTGPPDTAPPPSAATISADPARHISLHRWTDAAGFATGHAEGTMIGAAGLTFGAPAGTLEHADPYGSGEPATVEYARWTSPTVTPGFALTELVASWNAVTPGASWIEITVRAATPDGPTGWYVLGRWAADDTDLHRTSLGGQGDAHADVDADTLRAAAGARLDGWQARVTLLRPVGSGLMPAVRSVGAMASALPAPETVAPSAPGPAAGRVLDVPRYSQRVHAGEYPQWDGGGDSWCSPTSTAMVLAYWGTGPGAAECAWVDPGYADPCVTHAVRSVFDYRYNGAGNWSFNAAYAGRYGVDAFVTRLRSLAEAEAFILAGVPLVVSASFRSGQVTGLDYDTKGHLMVLVGFTDAGGVVLNDPYSADNDAVRKTVDRAEFERAWLRASGGIVYVIHPPTVALPPAGDQPNW